MKSMTRSCFQESNRVEPGTINVLMENGLFKSCDYLASFTDYLSAGDPENEATKNATENI